MQKGLVHIYFGDGKGKTTCAAGLAVRCAGAGGRVLWFQYLKKDTSGERAALEKLPGICLLPGYEKIRFSFQMTEDEKKAAAEFYKNTLEEISFEIKNQSYDLLILDEVIAGISAGMVSEEAVLEFLRNRPEGLEVVLTGRNPSKELLEMGDYITEMKKRKHPYDEGIPARRMVEY